MKPLNLIALLLFLGAATWALTRSESAVRDIQSKYFAAISPFLKSGSELETHARAFLEETNHSKALETELEAMRGEMGRLRLIESRYRDLETENNQMRRALAFKKLTRFDVVGAQVIRRQPTTWWQTVEIDAGEKSGIALQYVVLSNEGLVGKIDRIDKDRSSVLLLTDEKCLVSAKVEGSREVGILSGQRSQADGEPRLRLKYLSKDAQLKAGQRVLTTGLGGIFQPNIVLGTIESVESDALNSEAIVRPAVDFADLSTVFVVLSGDP
ncbi:rod shape-determining protein MreC [Luteolibacter pohnpeiensis]|uniref:Cell shape-determining protein MreC n=1 Tax=Luteolibacter pohnpeiensis TaxID=454153 RepID=A0A934S4I4_9BACT|nr:rod shape-determining protein MreC [Luteolibacter pohnpeiensis]MBK1882137.1 rod shape-determining protein MreC [Luteolibacter pohnpeiensis]